MNTYVLKISAILVATLALVISGCAAPIKSQANTGFISDYSSYSSLKSVSDTSLQFTSPKLGEYSSFIVIRPEMMVLDNTADDTSRFSPEELEELSVYFHDRMVKEISEDDGYPIVEEPGPNVATIRLAITALDASDGALNILLYTKITGAGLGGAAMEGEVIDSITREQLSAEVQFGNGSRILRAGFTKMGDAKLQINKWSKNLRKRIDDAHAQPK